MWNFIFAFQSNLEYLESFCSSFGSFVQSSKAYIVYIYMEKLNERSCYCDLWDKDPSILEKQGVPKGFCGLCEKCHKAGHMRHHPGAVPYTGSWCDHHYKILSLTHPTTPLGFILWLSAITGIFFLLNSLI